MANVDIVFPISKVRKERRDPLGLLSMGSSELLQLAACRGYYITKPFMFLCVRCSHSSTRRVRLSSLLPFFLAHPPSYNETKKLNDAYIITLITFPTADESRERLCFMWK